MQYVVTIVGHLKQQNKPESLPDTVSDFAIVTVKNKEELAMEVRQQMLIPMKFQAMMVRRNNVIFDPKKLDVDYITIPLDMFSHIEPKVHPLIGEEPMVTPEGELVNQSGKPVVIH